MKKIAYKFLSVIAVLVIICLVALQILGSNIRKISQESGNLLEQQVNDLNLIQTISRDYEEIYRLTLCHTMSTAPSSMEAYEKQLQEVKTEMQTSMEEYKSHISDAEIQTVFQAFEAKVSAFQKTVDSIVENSGSGKKDMATIYINNTLGVSVSNLEGYISQLKEYSSQEFAKGEKSLEATTAASSGVIVLTCIAMLVAAVIIYFVSKQMIVRPINKATKELQEIIKSIQDEDADLSRRIPVHTKDEIAVLTKGINQFLEILENLIRNIRDSSLRISEEQKNVFERVEKTQESADDTSSTMEELAAGMEEVTATVSVVTGHAKEARETVQNVTEDVNDGFHFAGEMQERADGLKQLASESKQSVVSVMDEIDKALVQSLEDSRQINQITSLTDEILGIAAQTNLLALNASIEAARAGEAGRGFAVVADEIRQLADSSKTTANNIQEISKEVVKGVTSLSDNASKLLKFVNENVKADYDKMENIGAQYLEDATKVTDIMDKISGGTQSINQEMEDVVDSNVTIADTVEQNATGIGNVAENTNELAEDMKEIFRAMQEVQSVIDELTRQAEIFRISDASESSDAIVAETPAAEQSVEPTAESETEDTQSEEAQTEAAEE